MVGEIFEQLSHGLMPRGVNQRAPIANGLDEISMTQAV
jgi:hypothetical protein